MNLHEAFRDDVIGLIFITRTCKSYYEKDKFVCVYPVYADTDRCEMIGDIFGAGVYTGIILVVIVIVIIVIIAARAGKRK